MSAHAPANASTGRWQRSLRAGRRWAGWGAALGVVFGLVTQAPAQWLADSLARATQGRLLLFIGAVAMGLLGLELYRLFG